MKKYSIVALVALFTVSLFVSCSKDSLEPTLADSLPAEIYTEEDMRQFIDGSYNIMVDYRYWGRNIIITGEVRADNVYANLNSGRFIAISQMNYNSQNGDISDMMTRAYGAVANANLAIQTEEVEGDQAMINHMRGEAYAIRALAHFDLLRLYGQQHVSGQGGMSAPGVSYSTSWKGDELYVPRSTVEETKQFIYNDLDSALAHMNSSLNDGTRLRMTTAAVHAIRSRVATYFREYSVARSASQAIMGQFPITPADQVVSSWAQATTSPSSIFELAQTPITNNGINGIANIYRGNAYGDIQVINAFPTDAEFGPNDVRNSEDMIRFDNNNRLRNVGKYPMGAPFSDNIKVIRYEEIVLNYAEALIETNPALALQHLNSIATNRNGTTYTVANIENILKERRKELAFEGFRFDDLVRTGRALPNLDPNLPHHGGVPYGDTYLALPIPNREIRTNPFTVQNAGYTN